jgi:hypothetical protein
MASGVVVEPAKVNWAIPQAKLVSWPASAFASRHGPDCANEVSEATDKIAIVNNVENSLFIGGCLIICG